MCKLVYAQELGINLPTYGEIGASELRRVAQAIGTGQSQATWTQAEAPQAFDVAVMRSGGKWLPCHVGVMVDAGTVLHVEKASSACLEPITGQLMKHRIVGFWRHRGLA
ncbi:hypothetical protein [Roseovarius indicus]|uniref:hypothetical protein n=1 Tax=Roseovarius indicus TaxID=540747 RepID=UPI001F19CAD1|nr:hypothetical protein [Roseovarius indicus]